MLCEPLRTNSSHTPDYLFIREAWVLNYALHDRDGVIADMYD